MHFPRPDEYDALVIHRPLAADSLDRVRQYRSAGLRVLVDEDDLLDAVGETKNELGIQLWTEQRRAQHDAALAEADGVIVTTDALAEHYRSVNPNVHVVRNRLPNWVQEIRWFGLQHDAVHVGWAGITKTHRHDLEWLEPVAAEMLRGCVFSNIGDAETPNVLGCNGMPMESFGFQYDAPSLYKLMARADVGIVPLRPCRFNEAKSWLKALEYMTLGVPVVATDLPEMRKLISHADNGFLARTPREFAAYVRILVEDPESRAWLGERGRERARELQLESHVHEWETVLRGD